MEIHNQPSRRINVRIKTPWFLAVSFILATVFLGIVLYGMVENAPAPLSSAQIEAIVGERMASATPPAAFSAQVYQTILPSLVLIQTREENAQSEGGFGLGSGVVVNAEGDILTALHVVEGAAGIVVTFADGTKAPAQVIATEPDIDIAVLHPGQSPELIVPAILGNPNGMRVGDEAYATGNPLGLPGSMSAGVISGFNRSMTIDDSERRIEGLIQFDAAVNPGNSGGPLLNRYGQVIGIVTGLANPTDQSYFIGIGFAVPITVAGGAAGAPDY